MPLTMQSSNLDQSTNQYLEHFKYVESQLLLIDETSPTHEQILNYLNVLKSFKDFYNEHYIDISIFYDEESLAYWKEKFNYYSNNHPEIPSRYNLLKIRTILMNSLVPFLDVNTEQVITTFKERTDRAVKDLEMWLSTDHPETPQQKKARLNREAQKRYQQRRRNRDPIRAAEIKKAYDIYMEACRIRKEAISKLTEKVEHTKNEWIRLRDSE